MNSVRDPRISPSMVYGDNPANMRTGALPAEALCAAAPVPEVPTSTCTIRHCGLLVNRAEGTQVDLVVSGQS